MSKARIRSCGAIGLLALANGCAGTPALDQPAPPVAQAWSRPAAGDFAAGNDLAAALQAPALAELIARARRNSPTLLVAASRIDQARAQARLARGAALPQLALGGSLAASNSGGSRFDFAKSYATLDAAFSIDFAGGVAAGNRAAGSRVAAAGFDRRAAEIALTADIARTWVALLAARARVELIDHAIGQAGELLRVVQLRQREGDATPVDVGLQATRKRQLEIERDRLLQTIDETRASLALLVGEEAPGFTVPPGSIAQLAVPEFAPPPPAVLIATRPDVRAAEARIAAAGGDVKAARAAFYPRLDLSLQRSAQSALTSNALSGVTMGATLMAPIFARGQLTGNLELAAARQREAVQDYRQALLGALAAIEQAMAAVDHARARTTLLAGNIADARRTVEIARRQYLEGEAELRQLVEAQEQENDLRSAEVLNRQERLEAAILMFAANRG